MIPARFCLCVRKSDWPLKKTERQTNIPECGLHCLCIWPPSYRFLGMVNNRICLYKFKLNLECCGLMVKGLCWLSCRFETQKWKFMDLPSVQELLQNCRTVVNLLYKTHRSGSKFWLDELQLKVTNICTSVNADNRNSVLMFYVNHLIIEHSLK